MNSCAPQKNPKLFITLWLLTSALLRPLPIGESENAPLPFSAASTLSHGIASPLPAVSESGKVKPRPPCPPKCTCHSSPCSSSSNHVCVCVPLGGLSVQLQPRAVVFFLWCMFGWAVCTWHIIHFFLLCFVCSGCHGFFLSQKTLRGNNTVTLQTQWMEMNLNHLHVLSGWIKTKPFHLSTVEGP